MEINSVTMNEYGTFYVELGFNIFYSCVMQLSHRKLFKYVWNYLNHQSCFFIVNTNQTTIKLETSLSTQ